MAKPAATATPAAPAAPPPPPAIPKAMRAHLTRIRELLARGEAALLDLLSAILAFEQSGTWRVTGKDFPRVLLDEVGLHSPGLYSDFKEAMDAIGAASIRRLGVAATREVLRVTRINEQRDSKPLVTAALARIAGFRGDRGYLPSASRARALVRKAAEAAGFKVDAPIERLPRIRLLVAALEQIASDTSARADDLRALARQALADAA